MEQKKKKMTDNKEFVEDTTTKIKSHVDNIQDLLNSSISLMHDECDKTAFAKDVVSQMKVLLEIQKEMSETTELINKKIKEFKTNPLAIDYVDDRLFALVAINEDSFLKYKETNPDAVEISVSDKTLEFLKTPIIETSLCTHTVNVLKAAECEIMYDVVKHSRIDLLKLRNFGRKGIIELEELIKPYGLYLGMLFCYNKENKEYRTYANRETTDTL